MVLALDAAVWGGLRDYIDLSSLIFAKLPLDAFFRLRVVCKEWNSVASDRAFLLEHFSSLQPPYFVVDTRSGARLLLRDAGWMWTRLPPVTCDSAGLLMVHSNDFNRVFDLHTRMVYALPDLEWGRERGEEEMKYHEEPVVGIIVDATVKPFAFQVVLGDELILTRIYDSRSGLWMQKNSVHEDVVPGTQPGRTVSAFCDHILYIRTPSLFSLHLYNVRNDQWTVEVLPGYAENFVHGYEYDEWMCCFGFIALGLAIQLLWISYFLKYCLHDICCIMSWAESFGPPYHNVISFEYILGRAYVWLSRWPRGYRHRKSRCRYLKHHSLMLRMSAS